MILRTLPALAALLFSLPAFSHSADVGDLHIGHPWARPTVGPQPTGGAYLSIENRGKNPDALVRVTSPVAREVQVHTMQMEGNVMRMREADKLTVPAGGKVEMKPGDGYHLMLMGLKQPLKAGERIPLTLTFEKAGQVQVEAVVEEKPRAAPAADAGHEHKH